MLFKPDLKDILISAIMNKEPVIIVEGKDDRKIYQKILNKIPKRGQVYQVNEFKDYASGCESVLSAIHYLQPEFAKGTTPQKYILGIIDQDVRPYKPILDHEIDYRTLEGLFILKYYSIETYFATQNNLRQLIESYTNILSNEISEEALAFVNQNIENSLEDLYYISLEALRNACEEGYENAIGFDAPSNRIYVRQAKEYLLRQIAPKKAALDTFAATLNLSQNDIKRICKGKWYLYNFVYRANHHIEQLTDKCRSNDFPQCRSCQVENIADCLYLPTQKYQGNNISPLYNTILGFIDTDECDDIITKLQELGESI